MGTRQRIAVIIGSTREGRVGEAIGKWFVDRAKQRDDVDLEVVDLVEFDFPSRYPEEVTTEMRRFTTAIGRADGFVVVTPAYNRSFPASLKQAIDYAYDATSGTPSPSASSPTAVAPVAATRSTSYGWSSPSCTRWPCETRWALTCWLST
jgi:NAD(P)H-dependent FMN reductase